MLLRGALAGWRRFLLEAGGGMGVLGFAGYVAAALQEEVQTFTIQTPILYVLFCGKFV